MLSLGARIARAGNGYIGGRLKSIAFGAHATHVELGGAAWVDSNRLMMALARELGVNHSTELGRIPSANISSALGVWDGRAFIGVEGVLLRRAGSLSPRAVPSFGRPVLYFVRVKTDEIQ